MDGFIVLSKNVLYRNGMKDLVKKIDPNISVYDSGCFEFDVPENIDFRNKIVVIDLYSCSGVEELLSNVGFVKNNTIVVVLRKEDPVMRYYSMKYGITKFIFIEQAPEAIREYLALVILGKGDVEIKSTKHSLTLREQEILKHVALGRTSKEIGDMLEISKNTVDTHRNKMLHKLNLSNSSELVSYAFRAGLLSDKMF